MTHIATLEREALELERQLHEKRMELHRAKVAALPWKVGDIIRPTTNEECKIVNIRNIDLQWPIVVDRKKDGTWGIRERTIYTAFEVITESPTNDPTT
jgi:hypothetical protein